MSDDRAQALILVRNAIEDVETLGAGGKLLAHQTLDNLLAALAELRAERDTLREALRRIADPADEVERTKDGRNDSLLPYMVARKALASVPDEETAE